jgi:hypothetical protein
MRKHTIVKTAIQITKKVTFLELLVLRLTFWRARKFV